MNQVARAKDGKNPYKGRIVNLKPHAYKRSGPYGGDTRVMACLLHNDPATYRPRPMVKVLCTGAEAKASPNRATQSAAVDAKPRELRAGRMKWG